MDQHNYYSHNSSRQSVSREHTHGTRKGKKISAHLSRPKEDNRDEWPAYWQAQGQSWRTEPEISDARQKELARCRATPADIKEGIYPFGGMKLDRADVEWLLATHENGRGPVVWSDEQQRTREGLDLRGADLRAAKNKNIDLSKLPLTRLRGGLTYQEGDELSEEMQSKALIQLEGVSLSCTQLEGACLGYVKLEGAGLDKAKLKEADLFKAQLKRTYLAGAELEGADLYMAQLEGANLRDVKLKGAFLDWAKLEGANLDNAQLEGATLYKAQLEKAYLGNAKLEGADISEARLGGAYLRGARLEGVNLEGVSLSGEDGIGPFLVDVQWGAANLTVVDWSRLVLLGEEYVAHQKTRDNKKKTKETHLEEYQKATRANRQLAVALLGQGLNEDAVRFAYRANVLKRSVYWYQIFAIQTEQNGREPTTWYEIIKKWFTSLGLRVQRFGSYSFSLFLDLLAGYGYKPGRTLAWYLFVVFGFAFMYALFGHLPMFPDTIVFSLMSFHGRGFFPSLSNETNLHNPLVILAAAEAVVGLLIELSFIATFTQRFFGN